MFYRICPACGAHLDPDEKCDDCQDKKEAAPQQRKRPQEKPSAPSVTVTGSKVKAKGRRHDVK